MTVVALTTPHDQTQVDAKIAELACLSPVDYDRQRQAVAEDLGIRISTLDSEVERQRPRSDDDAASTDAMEAIEPWPDTVNGNTLAQGISTTLTRHVVFADPLHADAAAMWIVGTYLMDTWSLWPKILVSSPEKRCGKTTLLETIEAFVDRSLMVSNISTSALFRAIEAWQPCLLIDEADRFLQQDETANGIINAGHRKRTAIVVRTEDRNGEWVPTKFSVWAPQVIAGIGRQADTLSDRSVRIGLRRKLAGETVAKLPSDFFEANADIRSKLARWAADNKVSIHASDIEAPNLGNDRAQDNWTPLYRLAAVLGADWPDRVAAAYHAMESVKVEDDDNLSAGILLLRDIAELLETRKGVSIGSTSLCEELVAIDDAPWAEWRRGKPITTRGIAKLLKPYGITSHRDRNVRFYRLSDFKDALDRYAAAPSQNCDTSVTSVTPSSSDTEKYNENNVVTDGDTCDAYAGVSDSKRHFGDEYDEGN